MTTQQYQIKASPAGRDAMHGIVCTTTHYNASAQTTFRALITLQDNKINMLDYPCQVIKNKMCAKKHKTV